MIFPITELLDEQESMVWVERHFHPQGLQCPKCGAAKHEAREFREHKSGVVDYRCHICQRTYNLYTGTMFAGSNLEPRRLVLLVRGVCKGDPATVLAAAVPGQLAGGISSVPRERREESEIVALHGGSCTTAGAAG